MSGESPDRATKNIEQSYKKNILEQIHSLIVSFRGGYTLF